MKVPESADVLVHPSRRDTTGTVLLEAVAAELPVLCTAACGFAEPGGSADYVRRRLGSLGGSMSSRSSGSSTAAPRPAAGACAQSTATPASAAIPRSETPA